MPRRPLATVALLTSLTLGVGLTGCAPPEAARPAVTGAPAAAAAAAGAGADADATGDAALVVEAVATTTGLRRAVDAARRRHGRLAARLAPVAGLHARQRDLLVAALPGDDAGGAGESGRALPRTPTAARALAVLARRERRAGRTLTDLAAQADSGRFARLLASMAAATGQVRLALGAPADDARVGGPHTGGNGQGGNEQGATDEGANGSGTLAEGEVAAAQRALAAEHAALWLYGVLGARTSATGSPALFVAVENAYEAHRARRDALTTWLRAAGADPVAAAPAYRLPRTVTSPRDVRRLGRLAEREAAGWWAGLVGTSVGPLRRDAAAALADAARREVGLGGTPQAFPGAPELG